MSFFHAAMLAGASGNQGPYQIEQSLRFNQPDSYTFRRTPGANSTSQKKFTFSVWSKRALVAAGATNNVGRQSIFYTGLANGSGNLFGLEWRDDEVACIFNGAGSIYPQTVAKFRDPSAWYHIVVAVDTDQATDTDRCKVYVNGVQQTLTGTLPTSGFLVTNGTTSVHSVGELGVLRSNQYLAEAYYINDQQLEPTDFAETNNYGVWIPKPYEGTFTGTNSYYLKFDPAATNGIGHDDSGNGNNFTTTNFTTSGTGTDVMSDTPTTNWCTLNPLDKFSTTIDTGNLVCTTGNSSHPVLANFDCPSSGRWYWEIRPNPVSDAMIGVQNRDNVYSTGYSGSKTAYYRGGDVYVEGTKVGDFTTYTTDDIIGVALNANSSQITFYKNGTSITTQDLTSVEGLVPLIYQASGSGTCSAEFNFGQRAFVQTPPTNFLPLNTSNLPAPTVKDGSKNLNTVLYAGNTTSQSITGFGFQPDLAWVKKRNGFQDHEIEDAVRGATQSLSSSLQRGETTDSQAITAFTSDGFNIGSSNSVNENRNYVAWAWKANGSGSSNTDGNINSTVSANATAGFSIVTYNGSTQDDTVGHGLGVAPSLIIFKRRNNTTSWPVYHSAIGPSNFVQLNETTASGSSGTSFGSTPTAPTSTVFSVGDNGGTNYGTMVAYCFAEVEGYTKFGSYTGNGSSDGPFVYCGFRPAFVLFKSTGSDTNWTIIDSARSAYNPAEAYLKPNAGQSETNLLDIDMLSNGFKLRGTSGGDHNQNGTTFIFAAFAENPFGGSGVSPVTAR